jgi:hypothetical protein
MKLANESAPIESMNVKLIAKSNKACHFCFLPYSWRLSGHGTPKDATRRSGLRLGSMQVSGHSMQNRRPLPPRRTLLVVGLIHGDIAELSKDSETKV